MIELLWGNPKSDFDDFYIPHLSNMVGSTFYVSPKVNSQIAGDLRCAGMLVNCYFNRNAKAHYVISSIYDKDVTSEFLLNVEWEFDHIHLIEVNGHCCVSCRSNMLHFSSVRPYLLKKRTQ